MENIYRGIDMVKLIDKPMIWQDKMLKDADISDKSKSYTKTMSYHILKAHNKNDNMDKLRIRFDAMASHDITYVGIILTAKASGMTSFPIPYVLTNCHNSLCAVGGTINEDDHIFGLSACKKYGGIYVPAHIAVIHQYMREHMAGCGKMIIGSDSHTRYGAIGTMAVGEGGGELVKQLLSDTYDIDYPDVVAVHLSGKPRAGVGPHDISLAIIKEVYANCFVKNAIMEFIGDGISSMTMDYRNSIDVMTTETTCLSSIWQTDEDTKNYLTMHGRSDDYIELHPEDGAYYDRVIEVDLDKIEPMIALPFHPSNAYTIREFNDNAADILREVEKESTKYTGNTGKEIKLTDKIKDGKVYATQGIIAGCAGGNYTNVAAAADILDGNSCGDGVFSLSIYPSSQPVNMAMVRNGISSTLIESGAIIKTAFCGPCFGAGDTPSDNGLSIRHTTRNFPNREGSKPMDGQMSAVALMDARSIAATAINGGMITPASDVIEKDIPIYTFDNNIYKKRIYNGWGHADNKIELAYGPNIKDWPEVIELKNDILMKVCSVIDDPVTTTDELIPSGETSSYRSNPEKLSEFTLSRRDPAYVSRAKEYMKEEIKRRNGNTDYDDESLINALSVISDIQGSDISLDDIEFGSMIYARKPGDGSAREQAASCQRVLGGIANITHEYATKRYRSNMINWGMIPFRTNDDVQFDIDDYIYVPDIRDIIGTDRQKNIKAYIISKTCDKPSEIEIYIDELTCEEADIIKAGNLINYNKLKRQ